MDPSASLHGQPRIPEGGRSNAARSRRVPHRLHRSGGRGRGGEGVEFYLDPVTLGAQAGYFEAADTDDNGYYARGLLRFYPADNLKLEGIGGVTEIESDVIPHARALVEYWPPGWPLGLFARWEGAFDNLFDQHFAVAGFRLYLESMRSESPLTLRETDRLYFRESCVHFLLFARTC